MSKLMLKRSPTSTAALRFLNQFSLSGFIIACTILPVESRIAVWSSENLPPEAEAALNSWPPPLRIVTDSMCEVMARQHTCNGYFRTDVLSIMKADACRYMAVYKLGGTYADLDVTLKRPVPPCLADTGLCVGYEYPRSDSRRHLSNYLITASARKNTCIKKAIDLCCNRLASVQINFDLDPHLVHNTCGPAAFTEAVAHCASKMSNYDLNYFVSHSHASARWKGNYPSWIEERKKIAGWKNVYEH